MLKQDRIIGMTVYGWTEEKTRENTWRDPFFRIWRSRPLSKKDLYPSWSESKEYALGLIEHLSEVGFEVTISKSDVGFAVAIGSGDSFCGVGKTVPQALAFAIGAIRETTSSNLIANIEIIKQSIERNL